MDYVRNNPQKKTCNGEYVKGYVVQSAFVHDRPLEAAQAEHAAAQSLLSVVSVWPHPPTPGKLQLQWQVVVAFPTPSPNTKPIIRTQVFRIFFINYLSLFDCDTIKYNIK